MRALMAFLKIVFSRTMLCLFMIFLQIYFLVAGMFWLRSINHYIYLGLLLLSAIMIIFLLNSEEPVEFKTSWILLCCIDPFLGLLLFNFAKLNPENHKLMNHLADNIQHTKKFCITTKKVKEHIFQEEYNFIQTNNYLENTNSYGTYQNTEVVYFSSGNDMFQSIIEELEQAKDFIFLEFFIIDKGYVWNTILDILKRKVQEGVDVRILYDGMCSIFLLPYSYPKKLKEFGIKAKMFSPIKPLLSTTYNYRDHRKIIVIDGKTSFTGGLNLADEYINRKERFGYWKDSGIRIIGEATNGFTKMFLQMWSYPEKMEDSISNFMVTNNNTSLEINQGYVIPYGDGPHIEENIAKNIYLSILNTATKYVHIMTPYLILDAEFENALIFAAKKGIEVKIIMPHIPDKKAIFAIGRTFYPALLHAGIKIYEFTPGFSHGKYFVSDDKVASVGSINLDYRSLYLHFECSALLYKMDVVHDVEKDFANTLKYCQEISMETYCHISWIQKLAGRVFRLLAPLL
jgi:cardiolipin synthase